MGERRAVWAICVIFESSGGRSSGGRPPEDSFWMKQTVVITLAGYGVSQNEDKDWSLGCFKQNTSTSCFNVTAGDYDPLVNMTGKDCAGACSALNISSRFAGLTANGVCMCSQSDVICLPEATTNASCLYPQSDGLYYNVYKVSELPKLKAPSSIPTFAVFSVAISSADPNCSYTLDFDDGVKKIFPSGENRAVSHYYASAGEYKITLSSHPKCLPQEITAAISSSNKKFNNASLECPELIASTAKESCVLSVERGSNLNLTNSTGLVASLPDTVVETISLPSVEESDAVQALENGTYVFPLLSAANDGTLIGLQFDVVSNNSITIQILSPKCEDGWVPCRGGCVQGSCTAPNRTGEEMISENCAGSDVTVKTESNNSTKYIVSEEFAINTTKTYKNNSLQLSEPVPIKRGDVIAFHASAVAVAAKLVVDSTSYVLSYCGKKFNKGDEISVSDMTKWPATMFWVRLHLSIPQMLEIPINPKIPSVSFEYEIVSQSTSVQKLEKTIVEVEELIGALEILHPPYGDDYYPTDTDIRFDFNVSNGTSVTYTLDTGNGTRLNTSRYLNVSYTRRGIYLFTVTAWNRISNVSKSQNISLAVDVKNLSFVVKPSAKAYEVNKAYNVSFSLEAGDQPTFYVEFGNNVSVFMMCTDNAINKEMTANVTYSKEGNYTITVTALSSLLKNNKHISSSVLTIDTVVEIMSRIQNLTVYGDGQALNASKSFFENYPPGKAMKLHANVSSGSPVHYTYIVHGNDVKEGSVDHGPDYTFDPPVGGLWRIVVVAKNDLNYENYTLNIDVVNGCESETKIYDRRKKEEPFNTTLANDIRFSTEEEFYSNNCSSLGYYCWTFNWTLYYQDETRVPNFLVQHKNYFFIEKGRIEPGRYIAKLNAMCNETNRTSPRNDDETYFDVVALDPVAVISGGIQRDVPQGEIILDASESYNQNFGPFDKSYLSFCWKSNDSKIILNEAKSESTKIDATNITIGTIFKAMLTVTDTKYGKMVNTAQIVKIVESKTPTTKIVCKLNCLPFVDAADKLSLAGNCLSCGSDVRFVWILITENRARIVLNERNTLTGFEKENLVFTPDALNTNTKYLVRLIASHNGLRSSSDYLFTTAGTLTGGKCEMNVKNGTALETAFRVTCSNWRGGKAPLTYTIHYHSAVKVLWYEGLESVSPRSQLPEGKERNDYNITITVEIRGRYGSHVIINLSVQVRPQKRDNAALVKSLEENIDNLDRLGAEDDPEKTTQRITLLSEEVNNADEAGKITRESSEKLRHSLVEKLSDVKATTLPEIERNSKTLKLITRNNTQVTHDTQESAVEVLGNLSRTLLNIASNPATKTGKQLDASGEALLSAISSVMDASLFTGRETSRSNAPKEAVPNLYGTLSREGQELEEVGKETKSVVDSLDKVFELTTASLAKNKLIGEKATNIETPNFDLKLTKIHKERNDDQLGDIYKDKIFFTGGSLNFSSQSTEIFVEAITFKQNPYTSDIKHSHYIQPYVFTFNFRSENGREIIPKVLKDDIEITLKNRNDSEYNHLNNSADNKEFFMYHFQVDEYHYEETIMIVLRKDNSEYGHGVFYVKFGEKVSLENYDFKQSISKSCQNCSGYPMDIECHKGSWIVFVRAKKRLRAAKGKVSVGLLPCPNDADNSSSTSCDPMKQPYEILVQTISCRYWNDSEWIKDGCRVGRKSTPHHTSCLCNHLTSFSSYIVKPNPLTKFSLEDFRQGYVCFVAVSVIFIFYFILLLWARRADRDDSCKVGVCGLADNRPGDRYRYEIAIWTGMRRNAGTRSEVSIILSGDKNDSNPRSLVNPHSSGFTRASLEKFLLTTSKEIGSLYCIRIWHDNSLGSWFLSRVMVTDLQKDQRYYFICDRWLAVDEDDGQVERLLPVASDEELADFHHLFYSKTKRGLSDTHLWMSVINRPPQSTFTRIQRLSCCVCILMTTMVANAMFYQRQSEPKPNSTNFIGSYSFTWDQVFIGVVSSLIIVPVNLVILNIFRNVRPKSGKGRSQSKASVQNLDSGYYNIRDSRMSSEVLEISSNHGTKESMAGGTGKVYSRLHSGELKRRGNMKLSRWARFKQAVIPSSLPHWFVYVGWVILVLVTLGSAAVVILYGMQFGNGRSIQWLISIVISIVEDIFVLQPLKVLLFALGFALLVKKPDEGEFEMSENYDDNDVMEMEIVPGSQDNIAEKKAPPRIPLRPSEEQLAVMRKARMKERKMYFLIHEITVHLIFMVIIALVTYGHKDTRSVHLYRQIDSVSTMTDQLHSFENFWSWSRVVLIPKVFPEKLYNGDYVPSFGFFDDGSNNLISRARMRLLRVKNDPCEVPDEFKGKIHCLEDYSIFNEDDRCYRKGWEKAKGGHGTEWCYQDWKALNGYPTWGIFDTYSGNGYVRELIPGADNNETVTELESNEWLDKQSRAVFVELTTYNANVNLYTSIRLLFEFPEFGGIFYFKSIVPMRLKLYVGGFAFFIFACEMAFLLFIVAYTYVALKKIYRRGMAYFKEFWNAIDFATLMTSYAAVGVYVYRIGLTTNLMRRVSDRDGSFVNFQYVTYWNEVLNWIMALVVAITTVKLTKLMRFNLRVSLFGKTLQDAKPALAGFSLQFGIVFFAYIMMGVLIFGYNVTNFKSIPSAMMALGRVILGKSQFNDLFLADRVIGPVFFFTYVMFVCWVLMSMFVAILTDSYHDVQDRCFGMKNEYEIVDFFIARFRAWSGFGGKKTKIPANKRWRQAGAKAKVAAALGHQRSYKPSEENIALEKTGDLMEQFEDSIKAIEKRVECLSAHFQ